MIIDDPVDVVCRSAVETHLLRACAAAWLRANFDPDNGVLRWSPRTRPRVLAQGAGGHSMSRTWRMS